MIQRANELGAPHVMQRPLPACPAGERESPPPAARRGRGRREPLFDTNGMQTLLPSAQLETHQLTHPGSGAKNIPKELCVICYQDPLKNLIGQSKLRGFVTYEQVNA